MVTKLERRDVGAYSEVKVIALGKAPPKPKPVRNFQIIRVCKSAEKEAKILAIPNIMTDPIKIGLRPNLSDNGPK